MMKGTIVARSMKACGTAEVQLHVYLTSKLDEGEWSAPRFGHFPFKKEAPVPIEQESRWTSEPVWAFCSHLTFGTKISQQSN